LSSWVAAALLAGTVIAVQRSPIEARNATGRAAALGSHCLIVIARSTIMARHLIVDAEAIDFGRIAFFRASVSASISDAGDDARTASARHSGRRRAGRSNV